MGKGFYSLGWVFWSDENALGFFFFSEVGKFSKSRSTRNVKGIGNGKMTEGVGASFQCLHVEKEVCRGRPVFR